MGGSQGQTGEERRRRILILIISSPPPRTPSPGPRPVSAGALAGGGVIKEEVLQLYNVHIIIFPPELYVASLEQQSARPIPSFLKI